MKCLKLIVRKRKRTLLVVKLMGISFTIVLIAAWGRKPEPQLLTVSGRVVDAISEAPLAHVQVSSISQQAVSDEQGRYELKLPAGVQELSFVVPGRSMLKKLLVARERPAALHLDVLAPQDGAATPPRPVLALDRGSSVISIADAYGNADRRLNLNTGSFYASSPVWLDSQNIVYAVSGLYHGTHELSRIGAFELNIDGDRVHSLAPGIAAQFLAARLPARSAIVIASQKQVFVLHSLAAGALPQRIFSLDPNKGTILAVAWASDDRIYLTIDESIPIDGTHSFTRSRIASMKPDGTDIKPGWASDPQLSFRYAMDAGQQQLLFCRFDLDGKGQTLWTRNLQTGKTTPFAELALRPVSVDARTNRLYYIYSGDLHVRNLRNGADWVIATSVRNADLAR